MARKKRKKEDFRAENLFFGPFSQLLKIAIHCDGHILISSLHFVNQAVQFSVAFLEDEKVVS